MNPDLLILAGVALLLLVVCPWMVRSDREARRLSHEAIERIKRDHAAAPFGRTERWEGDDR